MEVLENFNLFWWGLDKDGIKSGKEKRNTRFGKANDPRLELAKEG